jgi:outer membrane receptor for ferrienterochelin and colicins
VCSPWKHFSKWNIYFIYCHEQNVRSTLIPCGNVDQRNIQQWTDAQASEGEKMKRPDYRSLLAQAVSLTLAASAASAQSTSQPAALEEIEVLAKRVNARERTELAEPVLTYSEEFFQRFEPLSVGEMLKRVPGVTFSDDIGEYAAPSLRGIGSEYTQVLINGRRISGSGNDNSVLVDRIPAELVERVEIIRSPTSDMDSQGIGGTLNIILKEGAEFNGGIYRIGGYHIDGETRPSAFVSYGHTTADVQWGTSLNYQERFNRKQVYSVERAHDGEGNAEPELSATIEPDQRDTQDLAWTGDLAFKFAGGQEWAFNAMYVNTDRVEHEFERAFGAEDDDGDLDSEAEQTNQTDAFTEKNWMLTTVFTAPTDAGHSWELSASYDHTEGDNKETNYVVEMEDFDFADVGLETGADILPFLSSNTNAQVRDLFKRNSTQLGHEIDLFDNIDSIENESMEDSELKAGGKFKWKLASSTLSVGLDYVFKERDYAFDAQELDDGALVTLDELYSNFNAEDERINGFVQWSLDIGAGKKLELGVRGEQTNMQIASLVADPVAEAAGALAAVGLRVDGNRVDVDNDYFELNPSAHFRWDATDRLQLRLSAARTVRRPSFDELNPTLLLDEDESILGNPLLEQETALGFDGGFDLTLNAEDAILGVNAFYRRIENKIELNGVGDAVNAIFQEQIDEEIEATQYVNNPNKGTIYGVELDLSYPLAMLNAPNFHVFANYTYIHSEIRDANSNFPVDRPFSLQPDYVYNLGFDHLIEPWAMTWGVSYQKRGAAEEWVDSGAETKEVADVTFEGNLEVFMEKTFAERYVVRLAAQNLLDAKRKDVTRIYESVEQYAARTPVSSEIDQEESDPWVILTFRSTF